MAKLNNVTVYNNRTRSPTNSTVEETTSTSLTTTSDGCQSEAGCEFGDNKVIEEVFRTVHD